MSTISLKSGHKHGTNLQLRRCFTETLLTILQNLFDIFKAYATLTLKELTLKQFLAKYSRAVKRLVLPCFVSGGVHPLSSASFNYCFVGAEFSEILKCRIPIPNCDAIVPSF